MDPLTALGLAAKVLGVLDLSKRSIQYLKNNSYPRSSKTADAQRLNTALEELHSARVLLENASVVCQLETPTMSQDGQLMDFSHQWKEVANEINEINTWLVKNMPLERKKTFIERLKWFLRWQRQDEITQMEGRLRNLHYMVRRR